MQDTLSMFETGAATHVGKVRRQNEDNYLVCPEAGLWSVADGMGGHADGALASGIVVECLKAIKASSSAADLLASCEQRLVEANTRIQAIGRERGTIMGTTVAVLLIHQSHFACIWAGDSRIYRVRQGDIEQLSRDHTEVAELIAEGMLSEANAKLWPRRNVVTRAVGVHGQLELEMQDGTLAPGDVFLLCSDGLTAHVSDSEIAQYVATARAQDACERLISLTLERGAVDNVTVIVVRCQPGEKTVVSALASAPQDEQG